jgi:isopentenyl-diphosphate delta-isomerase
VAENSRQRPARKLAHLQGVCQLPDGPGDPGFRDVFLLHNCLPELDYSQIDLSSSWCGRKLASPLVINAITGGAAATKRLNAALARAAARFGMGMAVGSQTAAVEDETLAETFQVVRQEYPEGFIMANVSATAPVQTALKAVQMLRADALQVHLNVPQELAMAEGERSFVGTLENIKAIQAGVPVPVIVKEVGFGIAGREARRLVEIGIKALDVAGKGGTNFLAVEAWRRGEELAPALLNWGLPTVVSLLDVLQATAGQVQVMASGGVRSGLDAVKALSLGADMVGMAGPLVRMLMESEELLQAELERLHEEMRTAMLMCGAANLTELRERVNVIILGETKDWLQARGISVRPFACRV